MRTPFLLAIFAAVLIAPLHAVPQQNNERSSHDSVQAPGDASPSVLHPMPAEARHFYRLDFVLREMEQGKLINQRAFTMNVSADPAGGRERTWWNLRAGTRFPVRNPNETNYVDVGVNLDITAKDAEDALQLELTAEISSLATDSGTNAPPSIRQIKVKGAVFAPLGKPTVVFTTEDPGSKHEFQLQVTPVRTH